jgi:hypothetical protein
VNVVGAGTLLVSIGTTVGGFAAESPTTSFVWWSIAAVTFVAGAILLLRPDPPVETIQSLTSLAEPTIEFVEEAADTPLPVRSKERRYLSRSPEQISALYMGKTTVQGDASFSLYEGQWIKVEGNVCNVVPLFGEVRGVNIDRAGSQTTLLALFRDKSRWPSLDVLEVGELVYLEGRIVAAHVDSVTLDDCEVLEEGSVS